MSGNQRAAERLVFNGRPSFRRDTLDLFLLDLNRYPPHLVLDNRLLSGEETARSISFRNPADRNMFVAGRWLARGVTAGFLQIETENVCIDDRDGKPRLHGRHRSGFKFNLAHSGNLVLLACHPDLEVGVDVEACTVIENLEEVARSVYTAGEREILCSMDNRISRREDFFRRWTIKESVMKCSGLGMKIHPRSIDTSGMTVKNSFNSLEYGRSRYRIFTRCYLSHYYWSACTLEDHEIQRLNQVDVSLAQTRKPG